MDSVNSKVKYTNIINVNDDVCESVRLMRNLPSIRWGMYTDHEISKSEHLTWIDSLKETMRKNVHVVHFDGLVAGIVSLTNIDLIHKTSDWGFYLDPAYHGGGLGIIVEYDLLEYAFGACGIEKLNCEVINKNVSVIKLHRKFGFREEGIFRKNVIKDGARSDVIRFGLLGEEWNSEKERFATILPRVLK